jgi:hypothetical protein
MGSEIESRRDIPRMLVFINENLLVSGVHKAANAVRRRQDVLVVHDGRSTFVPPFSTNH